MAQITVPINVNLDIHQVIDDAIAKKDRRVSIFITDAATSIHVEPFENDGRRDWITVYCDIATDSAGHTFKTPIGYDCPECGHRVNKKTLYCPMCGEALKGEQNDVDFC